MEDNRSYPGSINLGAHEGNLGFNVLSRQAPETGGSELVQLKLNSGASVGESTSTEESKE